MSRVTVDEALKAKLLAGGALVEVRDQAGRVLGRFLPTFDPSEWVGLDVTEEELDAQERAGNPRYTTDELIEKLRKLS